MFIGSRRFWLVAPLLSMFFPAAASAHQFQSIYAFTGLSDGSLPFGGVVIGTAGNLYGATRSGGHKTRCPADSAANQSDGVPFAGCGVIFELTPAAGAWTEITLHSFNGGSDGAYPGAGVIGSGNGLYGTNEYGGFFNGTTCQGGCGTVFEFDLDTNTLKTLHTFSGGSDGGGPYTALAFDRTGNLFGTVEGGDGADPTLSRVFRRTPPKAGASALFATIYPPTGSDEELRSRFVVDSSGNLYGTTRSSSGFGSCSGSCGTLFELSPPAVPGGPWTETPLFSFTGGPEGGNPSSFGLTLRVLPNGALVLYGTTVTGGDHGQGTVFAFAPATRTLTTLYAFSGGADGGVPFGAELVFEAGALYGTTLLGGGAQNAGTVFKLKPVKGQTRWSETVLHAFKGGADGALPVGALAFDASGTLYGATAFGGVRAHCLGNGSFPAGCGTVFKITP